MTRQRLSSEARWTRYESFYEQNVLAVLQTELPTGVVSLIEYVQNEFDFIAERQKEALVGGGPLHEYEAHLVLSLATLPENFNFLIVRQVLEILFSEALSAERIVAVGSGDEVMPKQYKTTISEVVALINRIAQTQE